MNLSARSLFGLWTWHISIQYSRITVLAYKTSHFFFLWICFTFWNTERIPNVFFCVFQTSYWDENISSEVNWKEQNWQEDDNGKVNSQKTKPYQWSLTSYNFVLRKAHETPPAPFFLNQHQIILPCSTFKISILYCEEQMLYGDERLHYLHRWDYCCLCMTSAHFFVITNEFVLLVKVCSRWGHVIYFCTVT